MIPPANGVDYRILNGYVYLSPVPAPPEDLERRAALFTERAGFYFANWDRLYDDWLVKIRDLVGQMNELRFTSLPDVEDLEVVTSGRGTGSGHDLLASYHRLVDLGMTLWQYHFEFLNLGYAAYLDFFGFCKTAFPSIPDLAIAKMVAGVDVDLFRPDDELKRLARLAVSSGVDDRFAAGDVSDTWAKLQSDEAGQAWIAEWDKAAEPWFNFSTGSGFYHSDKIWIENTRCPSATSPTTSPRSRRASTWTVPSPHCTPSGTGSCRSTGSCSTPTRTVRRSTPSWGSRARSSPTWRTTTSTSSTGPTRCCGARCGSSGEVLTGRRVHRAAPTTSSCSSATSSPTCSATSTRRGRSAAPARGPRYWPAEVKRRRGIHEALKRWSAPPALGVPPEVVTEPFTVMLWGITSDSVSAWLELRRGGRRRAQRFRCLPGPGRGPGAGHLLGRPDR